MTTTLLPELTTIPVFVVLMEEELITHDTDHPFCGLEDCPCKADDTAFTELVEQPVIDGLMTACEAYQLYWGNNV